jgi:predicted DNA binding CopG/RHH family protein
VNVTQLWHFDDTFVTYLDWAQRVSIKAKAKAQGVPYTRYVRMLLEADVAQSRQQ